MLFSEFIKKCVDNTQIQFYRSSQNNRKSVNTFRSLSHNSRNTLTQPLFKKISKDNSGVKSSMKSSKSKSPIKKMVISKGKVKMGNRTRGNSRSITPVVKKRAAFYTVPNQSRPLQREPAPFAWNLIVNQYENMHTGESIIK
jgi:hypothetical protein